MTLDDLAARFQACTIPHAEWTHSAHLRVGAWHVHRLGAPLALDRLRAGIRRLNESHGTPNSETRGYHETITAAYVRLIDEYLVDAGDAPLEATVDRLLSGPLAQADLLFRFWSKDVLMSPRARAEWVPTTLAPLGLAELR